jgi:hypothetical protein
MNKIQTRKELLPAPKDSPWYESAVFWNCISLGVSIVLTVVAAMFKDLRWLLFAAAFP